MTQINQDEEEGDLEGDTCSRQAELQEKVVRFTSRFSGGKGMQKRGQGREGGGWWGERRPLS